MLHYPVEQERAELLKALEANSNLTDAQRARAMAAFDSAATDVTANANEDHVRASVDAEFAKAAKSVASVPGRM